MITKEEFEQLIDKDPNLVANYLVGEAERLLKQAVLDWNKIDNKFGGHRQAKRITTKITHK